MSRTVTTRQGELLDLIVWRAYGGPQSPTVEHVLDTNYGLADEPIVLPAAREITLPDQAVPTPGDGLVTLWDD